ncbi:hypothetical protein WA538_004431, partial [Blastocystis sp. DL]
MILMCDSIASIQLARSSTASFADFPVYAAVLTIISTGIVAAAGVTIEKLMKSHRDMSIFQQSIWLYFWGAVVNFLFLFIENGRAIVQKITFHNFNFFAVLTVICNVYMGLVTGAILKYISSVVKAFTTAASLVITSIISSFVFNMELSLPFDLAVINLAVAVYLYKTAPVPKPSPKQVPVSMEMEEIPSEIPGIDSVVADSIQIGEDEDEIVIRKFKE